MQPVNPANPANPAGPVAYRAVCPNCGAASFPTTGGLIWFTCITCGYAGQLIATPAAASSAASSAAPGAIAGRLKAAGAGVQTTPGTAPQPHAPQPSWMAHVPSVPLIPPLVGFSDLSDSAAGAEPDGWPPADHPTLTLVEALAGDARLFGEEIAEELLERGEAACARDCALSVPQVWDRLQVAHGALCEALGGRLHLGDYPPDLEVVSRALVGVGVWAIIALQVVGQMGDDGDGDSGDAA